MDIQCPVVLSVKRKMKWEKEILKYVIKQGMQEEESFEQRPGWSERRVRCYGGHMALGRGVLRRENDILEHLLCTRPCSGGPGDSNELLNISIVYCLTVQAVLYQYYISYLSLIAWFSEIENSHIGKVSFLPNCLSLSTLFSSRRTHRFLFFRGS